MDKRPDWWKKLMINSSKINQNFLKDNFITEFDDQYKVIRNIRSKKIDIMNKNWLIYDAKIYKNNVYEIKPLIQIETNFDYKRIQSLYSNLSSLNIFQLYELRENYKKLNYSFTEVELQLLKLISYPIYLVLMTIFSALIMFNIKRFDSSTFKISLGLFFSVIIYYLNNFFFVLGSTERMPLVISVFTPLIFLTLINSFMIFKINEK